VLTPPDSSTVPVGQLAVDVVTPPGDNGPGRAESATCVPPRPTAPQTAKAVVDENAEARIAGLRSALAVLALISLLALLVTRGLPTIQPGSEAKSNAPPIEKPVAA